MKAEVEKRVSEVLDKANGMEAQLEQAKEERRQVTPPPTPPSILGSGTLTSVPKT